MISNEAAAAAANLTISQIRKLLDIVKLVKIVTPELVTPELIEKIKIFNRRSRRRQNSLTLQI